jgi:hypothetical protein
MDKRLAEWFAGNDTGLSSKCVALFLSAGVSNGSTPSDLNDWGRCMRLLERIPEWKPRMAEMAEAGGGWPALAKRWAELSGVWEAETGTPAPPVWNWPDCPKTEKLFREIGEEADSASGTVWTDLGGGVRMNVGPR